MPLRAHLYGLSAREHVLLFVLHHIAGDGWSLGPLLRDVARCMGRGVRGRRRGLRRLPVQYADYTLWQQEALGSENEAESAICAPAVFWREQLEGLPEQIELPSDRPRPAVASHRGGSVGPLRSTRSCMLGLLRLARAWGSQPVHGAAGWFGRAADAAGRRAPTSRSAARLRAAPTRAGRSDGVFCQHAGAAHRHVGAPSFRELIGRVRAGNLRPTAIRSCRSSGWLRCSTLRGRCRGIRCSR